MMNLSLGLGLGAMSSGVALPALSFNFLSGALDPRISFTRASTATFVGSNGLIQSAASGSARFDYSSSSVGTVLGLLIEEQRINVLLRSEALDNAAWTAENATISSDATTAPDGNATADKIVSAALTARTDVTQAVTTSAAAYTFSFFVKQASGVQFVQLFFGGSLSTDYANFDIQGGTVTGGTNTASSIKAYPNGWYRISVTTTAAAVASAIFLCAIPAGNSARAASFVGDGTKGFYAWGAQMELGAFPTSYIPTTSASVTRSADVATVTGTNFSAWWSNSAGTLIAEADIINASVDTYLVTTGSSRLGIRRNGSNQVSGWNRIGGTNDVVDGSFSTGILKAAYAIKSGASAICANGGSVTDGATTFTLAETQLYIGTISGASGFLNGHIRKITYYNSALPDSSLPGLTT